MDQQDTIPILLVVEDSPEDFELISRGLKRADINADIQHCINGDDALDYLNRDGEFSDAPVPSLIMLDLNLPGTDGRELLTLIKQNEKLAAIPTVVFSNSSNSNDVNACYAAGANSFVEKPLGPKAFGDVMGKLRDYWLSLVRLPKY